MRLPLRFSLLASGVLVLIAFSVADARAGSFLGPTCYGADYTYQYPNRSHNSFGCGPGTHCQARHPLFRHRWLRKHQNAQAGGVAPNAIPGNVMPGNVMPGNVMPGNVMPGNVMPGNVMPGNAMPIEFVQPTIVQAPVVSAPIHTTSVTPAPVVAKPAVQSRIVPVPARLPSGPANPEPPVAGQDKPQF